MNTLAGFADRSTVACNGRHVFNVAGVVAPIDNWSREFAPAWSAALAREGINHFRMSEFESRCSRPYASWTQRKRIAFLLELIAILEATRPVAGAVAVDLEAYARLPEPLRIQMGHPYRFCGALLLTRLSIMLRRDLHTDASVRYAFEAGDNGACEPKEAVDALSTEERRFLQIQDFAYGDKKDFIQLQAADILAYETAKAALRDIGFDHRPPRKSLIAICRICPGAGYLFNEPMLSTWAAENRNPFGFRGTGGINVLPNGPA